MSRRIYFGAPLCALTDNIRKGDSYSARLNRAAARYLVILRLHGLGLSEKEKEILSKIVPSGTFIDPRHMAHEVAGSKYAASKAGRSLIQKLDAATYADLVAEAERLGV